MKKAASLYAELMNIVVFLAVLLTCLWGVGYGLVHYAPATAAFLQNQLIARCPLVQGAFIH